MFDLSPEIARTAHLLATSPILAVQIRTDVLHQARSTTAAKQQLVAIVQSLGSEIEAEFRHILRETKRQKAELEGQIKRVAEQISQLKEQAAKLALIAQKIEELLPALLEAVASDSNGQCDPTPLVVSVRTAKFRRAQHELEAAANLIQFIALQKLLARLRMIVERIPVLFEFPVSVNPPPPRP
jgi:hypothetical protein